MNRLICPIKVNFLSLVSLVLSLRGFVDECFGLVYYIFKGETMQSTLG